MKKTEETIINFISQYKLISEGDKILIALSGGADSVFLTHFLHKFKKKYKISIGALHLNHMLRGEEAYRDQEFSRKLCKELDIPFISVRRNVSDYSEKHKISIEEAGRILRYKVLEQTARRLGYNKIATGHNSTDNAETILLNLAKGTGLRGLSGIPFCRGIIIRPILPVPKNEIFNYLNHLGIDYRTDETNLFNDYERNFLRNEIIPGLKVRLNLSLEESIFQTTSIIKEHYRFIENLVSGCIDKYVRQDKGKVTISTSVKEEAEVVFSELIKTVLERNFSVNLTFKDVNSVKTLFGKEKGSKLTLMDDIKGIKEKAEVVFFRPAADTFVPIVVPLDGFGKIKDKCLFIRKSDRKSFLSRKNGEEFISGDDIDANFIIRKWDKGDRFFPFGMKGSKKLSDFLNEKDVSALKKKDALVLTNRDRIVWVIGERLDNRFRITGKTRKVVHLWLK